MTTRLRVLRLIIVGGYAVVGLGVGLYFLGAWALIPIPTVAVLVGPGLFNWATGFQETARMEQSIRDVGREALTSEQMDFAFTRRKPTVIDDDPVWGKLVEGREEVFSQTLTAVQVTNSTPEPDGTYKKVWLRVPSRGDRQGTRVCMHKGCGKDISWPPRTAREAIAWTFRLCVDHYQPAKAS